MTTKNATGKWNVIDWEKAQECFDALKDLDQDADKYWEVLTQYGYNDKDKFCWESFLKINLPKVHDEFYLVEDNYRMCHVATYDGENNFPCFWVDGEIVEVIRWAGINQ